MSMRVCICLLLIGVSLCTAITQKNIIKHNRKVNLKKNLNSLIPKRGGTDKFNVDVYSLADDGKFAETIPSGSTLYHGSDVLLNVAALGGQALWVSPDIKQSFAAGRVKGVANAAANFYVAEFQTKQDIRLVLLPECASKGTSTIAAVSGIAWGGIVNPLMGMMCTPGCKAWLLATLCPALVALPTPLYGWRSPWDQDEVMLCPQAQGALFLQDGSYFTCATANFRANVVREWKSNKDCGNVANGDGAGNAAKLVSFEYETTSWNPAAAAGLGAPIKFDPTTCTRT